MMDKSKMLSLRSFVVGKDEELWTDITARAHADDPDYVALTVEQLRETEKKPDFDPDCRYFAEMNGAMVGRVSLEIDRKRTDNKGFIWDIAIVPEYRKRGIGSSLVRKALLLLKDRSVKIVETRFEDTNDAAKALAESYSFQQTRSSSRMEASLASVPGESPGGPSEKRTFSICESTKSDEDIALLTSLTNESFSEHFNYRTLSAEEVRSKVLEDPEVDVGKLFFAQSGKDAIGYVVAGIDKTYNNAMKRKCGWILQIGVLKGHRNRGAGTALLLHGMRTLKELGMEEAALYVDDYNVTNALDLYRKCGFSVKKRYLTYIKELQP
jgi:mycothiol synthase